MSSQYVVFSGNVCYLRLCNNKRERKHKTPGNHKTPESLNVRLILTQFKVKVSYLFVISQKNESLP